LVTSLAPLEVYVFTSFYGRLCSQPYKLADFEDVRIHLSNYSVNKQFFTKKQNPLQTPRTRTQTNQTQKKPQPRALSLSTVSTYKTSTLSKKNSKSSKKNPQQKSQKKSNPKKVPYLTKKQSVISSTQIKTMIYEHNGVEWDKLIQPKIEDIILTTIQACSFKMKHRDRSFEIYGFDIFLDSELNPWLLEVNLSPACAERTQFLKDMVNGSAKSLFEILKLKEKNYKAKFFSDVEKFEKEKLRHDELKKMKELRESYKGDWNAGFEGDLTQKFGQKIAESIANFSSMENSSFVEFGKTKVPKLRKPPMKLMDIFSELEIVKSEEEKEHFWKMIYEGSKKESSEKMVSKGQKGYMEVVGKQMKLKVLKKHDQIIKEN
jgi:hypothetical protein